MHRDQQVDAHKPIRTLKPTRHDQSHNEQGESDQLESTDQPEVTTFVRIDPEW